MREGILYRIKASYNVRYKKQKMTTLVANDAVARLIGGVSDLAEIRDVDGQLLGYFAPPGDELRLAYLEAAQHLDGEEIARRKASTAGDMTLAEAFQQFAALENRKSVAGMARAETAWLRP